MKLDLHLHTPSSVSNGDSIKWESTLGAIKTLNSKKVNAFAFTDHNTFSKERYVEARNIVQSNMIVFPGVEVDVLKDNDQIAHVLVIFNSNLKEEELKDIEHICRKELRKKGVRINTLNSLFSNYETIRIPHVGKSDFFTYKELDNLIHDAVEITSINHPNYVSWLKNKNDKSIVSFSDTHVWRDYPQNHNLETNIDFDGTLSDLKAKLALNLNYTKESI